MRKKNRHSAFLIFLLLGIGLPGFIGILGVQAKAFPNPPKALQVLLQIGTSTPTLVGATSTPISSTSTRLPPVFTASTPSLYAFIQAPNGVVERPYVILTAFSSVPRAGSLSIRGLIDAREFICDQSPCVVALQSSSRFVFRAYDDSSGRASDQVIASISVTQAQGGFLVTVDQVSQFTAFTDACSAIWSSVDETNATWDSFVQFPYQLNTRKTLHELATQLIMNGIVDTSACPAGGLSLGLDWPTACGLEHATPKMIEWQNQYDEYIWLASRDHGVPPKILKTLIEIESQFWPGNSRFYADEIGLGQINALGLDVLLRRDPTLYQRVCPGVLLDCSAPYVSLDSFQQEMIRGAVVSLADATCSTCQYGLDLDKAKESVSLIAMLLRANCEQVDVIINTAISEFIKNDPDAATATAQAPTATPGGNVSFQTTYEDYWRFTFAAYHSGVSCFQHAVIDTRKAGLPLTWENMRDQFNCKGGEDYVDGFIGNLLSFDSYLYQPSDADLLLTAPTFVPTRTPVPTPTVFVSSARVIVRVFMDRNGNGSPDGGEWIDAMTVLLTTSSNQQVTQRTQEGIAIFDMSGFTPGIGINVSLPGLYRSENTILPEQGDVIITFKFEQPPLPTVLP